MLLSVALTAHSVRAPTIQDRELRHLHGPGAPVRRAAPWRFRQPPAGDGRPTGQLAER